MASVTILKLTATNRFSRRIIRCLNKLCTARFKIKMQRGCFYMKRTEHLQKSFDVIFIVIPDKVEFERSVYLITAITGLTAISPTATAPPAGR